MVEDRGERVLPAGVLPFAQQAGVEQGAQAAGVQIGAGEDQVLDAVAALVVPITVDGRELLVPRPLVRAYQRGLIPLR
ncbi:hypothetical protein GCM10022419_093650 [Nonomuraea rosea]|uniref:Uncharacterized protein n=1 Tax=Nonomuraea rosea TaxID=638574 RepID=A0ABP6Z3G4_9ACTN